MEVMADLAIRTGDGHLRMLGVPTADQSALPRLVGGHCA
jgi:hypothetical protein